MSCKIDGVLNPMTAVFKEKGEKIQKQIHTEKKNMVTWWQYRHSNDTVMGQAISLGGTEANRGKGLF